jgi:hypothetical protein
MGSTKKGQYTTENTINELEPRMPSREGYRKLKQSNIILNSTEQVKKQKRVERKEITLKTQMQSAILNNDIATLRSRGIFTNAQAKAYLP